MSAWVMWLTHAGCEPRSPDGLGVCCPMTNDPCGCSDERGGFAVSGLECGGPDVCDGRWVPETDEHGCPIWRDVLFGGAPGGICCGCQPDAGPPLDASLVTSEDASRPDAEGIDASMDANSRDATLGDATDHAASADTASDD